MFKELKANQFTHRVPSTIGVIAASALLLTACAGLPSSLKPQSEAAAQIATLWWMMFGLGTLIWIGVILLLLVGLFRRRGSSGTYVPLPDNQHTQTVNIWILGGGIFMPTLVLIALIVLTVEALRVIPAEKTSEGVVIEVIGHQWWWEVVYPDPGITLRDEVRIPVGQPVEVRLSSVDVIHSFWVPELHGKFDLIPGRTHAFVLQADQPGEYRGRCAEFCGLRHARMTFVVTAIPSEEFTAWLASQP